MQFTSFGNTHGHAGPVKRVFTMISGFTASLKWVIKKYVQISLCILVWFVFDLPQGHSLVCFSHIYNFNTIVPVVPEIQKWDAHVRTCICTTQTACLNFLANDQLTRVPLGGSEKPHPHPEL